MFSEPGFQRFGGSFISRTKNGALLKYPSRLKRDGYKVATLSDALINYLVEQRQLLAAVVFFLLYLLVALGHLPVHLKFQYQISNFQMV